MDNNQRMMASIDQRIKFIFPHARFELLPLPGPPHVRYDAKLMIRNTMGAAEFFLVHREVDLSHHDHPDGPIAGYTEDFVTEMCEKMLGYLIGRLHRRGGYEKAKSAGQNDARGKLAALGLKVPDGVYFFLETIDAFTGDMAKMMDQTMMALSVAHVQSAIDEMVSRSARLASKDPRWKHEVGLNRVSKKKEDEPSGVEAEEYQVMLHFQKEKPGKFWDDNISELADAVKLFASKAEHEAAGVFSAMKAGPTMFEEMRNQIDTLTKLNGQYLEERDQVAARRGELVAEGEKWRTKCYELIAELKAIRGKGDWLWECGECHTTYREEQEQCQVCGGEDISDRRNTSRT